MFAPRDPCCAEILYSCQLSSPYFNNFLFHWYLHTFTKCSMHKLCINMVQKLMCILLYDTYSVLICAFCWDVITVSFAKVMQYYISHCMHKQKEKLKILRTKEQKSKETREQLKHRYQWTFNAYISKTKLGISTTISADIGDLPCFLAFWLFPCFPAFLFFDP